MAALEIVGEVFCDGVRDACVSELRSVGMCTVSNALDMSSVTMIVRCAGFFAFMLCVIVWLSVWRRVCVECFDLKPCCVCMFSVLF